MAIRAMKPRLLEQQVKTLRSWRCKLWLPASFMSMELVSYPIPRLVLCGAKVLRSDIHTTKSRHPAHFGTIEGSSTISGESLVPVPATKDGTKVGEAMCTLDGRSISDITHLPCSQVIASSPSGGLVSELSRNSTRPSADFAAADAPDENLSGGESEAIG